MKRALILIGWYSKIDDDWFPWAKKELEKKGYEVAIPDLPTIGSDLPDMEQMLKVLTVDKDTVVIGHSLGALLGLRLAERQKFKKLILVSGWDYNDLFPQHKLFWPNNLDHEKIKNNVKEFVVIHGSNDPYTTEWGAKEMAKRLNTQQMVIVPNGGHLSKKEGNRVDLPEILPYI